LSKAASFPNGILRFAQNDNICMADFQDQTLACKDCGSQFVWTAGEQQFYADKGFANAPMRCPACRANKKASIAANRKMFDTVCANCGSACQVPFEPKGDRPVYCSDCYKKMKTEQA
jgi:CxxC-x17-CxxC domain-containing protein